VQTAGEGAGARPRAWRLYAYRLACGAAALLLAGLLYQLLNAPALRVGRVEITGNRLLSREEIVQAAGVLGKSVFAVDKRQTAGAVAGLAALRKVEVAVALPDTVSISVAEYEPKYVWQAAGGSYLLDERGVVLAVGQTVAGLPTVLEVDGKPRRRGDVVDLAPLRAAAELAALWPARLGAVPVWEYGAGGLAVAGAEWRAELGDGNDLEAKVLALAAVVDHVNAAGKQLDYVDVSYPDRPYYRVKD